jgi:hypothetical protein
VISSSQRQEKSITVRIYRNDDRSVVIINTISVLSIRYTTFSNILLSSVTPYVDEITGNREIFKTRHRQLDIYSAFVKYLRRKVKQRNSASTFTDFKNTVFNFTGSGFVPLCLCRFESL